MKNVILIVFVLFFNNSIANNEESFLVKPIKVLLTGYYTPILKASSVQTSVFKQKVNYYDVSQKKYKVFYVKNWSFDDKLQMEGQVIVDLGHNSFVLSNDYKKQYNKPVGNNKNALKPNSLATDSSVIPYGSEVLIDGKWYSADDAGKNIKGNRIDKYFGEGEAAEIAAKKYKEVKEVYIKINRY